MVKRVRKRGIVKRVKRVWSFFLVRVRVKVRVKRDKGVRIRVRGTARGKSKEYKGLGMR